MSQLQYIHSHDWRGGFPVLTHIPFINGEVHFYNYGSPEIRPSNFSQTTEVIVPNDIEPLTTTARPVFYSIQDPTGGVGAVNDRHTLVTQPVFDLVYHPYEGGGNFENAMASRITRRILMNAKKGSKTSTWRTQHTNSENLILSTTRYIPGISRTYRSRALNPVRAELLANRILHFHTEDIRRERESLSVAEREEAAGNSQAVTILEEYIFSQRQFRSARDGHFFQVMLDLGVHPLRNLNPGDATRMALYHAKISRFIRRSAHRSEIAAFLRQRIQKLIDEKEKEAIQPQSLANRIQILLLDSAIFYDMGLNSAPDRSSRPLGLNRQVGMLDISEDDTETTEEMEVEHIEYIDEKSEAPVTSDTELTRTGRRFFNWLDRRTADTSSQSVTGENFHPSGSILTFVPTNAANTVPCTEVPSGPPIRAEAPLRHWRQDINRLFELGSDVTALDSNGSGIRSEFERQPIRGPIPLAEIAFSASEQVEVRNETTPSNRTVCDIETGIENHAETEVVKKRWFFWC